VTCAAFDRWLDEGLPEPAAAGARDHAARCARCAAELAAAEAIETGLMRATFTAPAHLTDAVMARVATLEAARVAPAPPSRWSDAFPWWVRAAGDPAAAFAAVRRPGSPASSWASRPAQSGPSTEERFAVGRPSGSPTPSL
jgi:hypothetical protein